MKKVVIFGTGEFSQVAYIYLTKDSAYEVVAFTVHEKYIKETKFCGLDVVPFEHIENIYPANQFQILITIGFSSMNKNRAEVYFACKEKGYTCASYISSKAVTWGEVNIGENCFIFENNVIQPYVHIGNNCILWSGNHVGHHSKIGDHTFVTSQVVISGGVEIGSYCFLGVNSTVRDHIKIGNGCLIGAGALILKSAEDDGFYPGHGTDRSAVPVSRLKSI